MAKRYICLEKPSINPRMSHSSAAVTACNSPKIHTICLASLGEQCELDVDECEFTDCVTHASCFNTYGSFSCECNFGYEGKYLVLKFALTA